MRLGPGGIVEVIQPALIDGLIEAAGRDGELVVGLVAQASAASFHVFVVDIVEILCNRSGEYVPACAACEAAALRLRIGGERKVREHDPVNPAAGVLIGSDQPERQRAVDKGKIQHSVDAAIEAAALRIGRINFSTHVNVVQIRLIGDQLDGSTHGSGPVERALRPSQNLNSVQIIKIGVDDDMPILRSRRRGHRDII